MISSSTVPRRTSDFRCAFAFEARSDPATTARPSTSRSPRTPAITADLLRIEGSAHAEGSAVQVPDAGVRSRRSVRQSFDNFIGENPAEGRPARGLRRRRRLRESSAACSSKAPSALPAPAATPKPTTPTPPGGTAAAAAAAARNRTRLRPDDSDRQVARSVHDPRPAAAPRQRGCRRQDDVPDPGRELDQHEDRPGAGARRSRRAQVRRALPRPGERARPATSNSRTSTSARCCRTVSRSPSTRKAS